MKVIERHPAWLRVAHWVNVPVLALMVWSGLLIYWANDVYPGFFPERVYSWLSLDHRLALGMAVHFAVAWVLVANGMLYLVLSLWRGHWREVVPAPLDARGLLPTLRAELTGGIPATPGRYNPAQKFAYAGVVILGVVEVLSGFAIYKPVQLGWLRDALGGYGAARLIHFACMLGLVSFTGVHIFQVTRAGWQNLRSMIAGFEEVDG